MSIGSQVSASGGLRQAPASSRWWTGISDSWQSETHARKHRWTVSGKEFDSNIISHSLDQRAGCSKLGRLALVVLNEDNEEAENQWVMREKAREFYYKAQSPVVIWAFASTARRPKNRGTPAFESDYKQYCIEYISFPLSWQRLSSMVKGSQWLSASWCG